jgi:hypothetical protein
MDRFWDLLAQSVIVQGILSLSLVFAVVYLSCTGQQVPETLGQITALAVGYYFGSKAQMQIVTADKARKAATHA